MTSVHARFAAVLLAIVSLPGCRRDMQDQPKFKPLQASSFFADGRSARPIPPNTIARGSLNDNDSFHTGLVNGVFLSTIPVPIDHNMMLRGQQRYGIYCSPCHGALGNGDGMVARRGFRWPADFHSERMRQAPPGYIFQVITYGYGSMPDYVAQIPVDDRWAIVAYVRALQLSRNANIADVPSAQRDKLEGGKP